MATRRPEGAALLVAGYGTPGTPALDASALHTLGQIGEALLATGAPWQIRRLTPTAGERYAADRATLKRHLDELSVEPVRAAIVVLLGTIVDVGGEPALVTGAQAREYPEDATLSLAWIRERLEAAKAEHIVAVVSARGDGAPATWLGALGTQRAQHVIAIDAPAEGNPLIDALLTGLCGDALDPRTGTVTIASLCQHVTSHAPGAVVQGSTASETLAQPPPLAGFWDVRRSQLAHRAKPRAPGEPEDLAGVVLPGRFRIDRLVARGTFGTVYRARQLAVERDVAIKVLHADIDPSSEDGRLFVHEIRSVGRMDHPNVVRIHQADITHDGRLFFAMELLDGSDLQQLGAAGVLPRERAIELVRQLLAGLGAAHDAGLVHADVKPANAIVIPRRGDADVNAEGDRLVLVDFGLARLRAPDRPAESAGGTPAYMAPEQLHEGRVDARSDLYAATLVLVFLMTGWRRQNAFQLAPPFELIADADLRAVIARALEEDPAKRYQTARELSNALTGHNTPVPQISQPVPLVPFRHLAPLTESDRGRLHGRAADLAVLTEHVLFRRSVVYTAPSGTGKTSLLRAGLLPRLEALGIHAVYLRCRKDPAAELAKLITASAAYGSRLLRATPEAGMAIASLDTVRAPPPGAAIADAITAWHEKRPGKLVLVLDQLEAALADPDFVPALLGFDRWPPDVDVSIVLSVREDYLARLVARTQELEPGMPIVRLPPLAPEGARSAILAPLTESRLAIEPELLDALLDDLERAAAAIGPEMGWGDVRAIYPPHLQLACTVLYEALGPGEATLTLGHYRRLGGFDTIVGEHLERVLDTELADGRDVIARDLFVALVTTAHERAMRPESELLAIVGAKYPASDVTAVLETLRLRGLLVRVRGSDEPGWELVHDSLVPRVLAWVDARDLARRRAIELVRYHLRRSTPDEPSLLDRSELRELRAHDGAIEELDAEWHSRGSEGAWSPTKLVERSRTALRRRTAIVTTFVAAALAIASAGMVGRYYERRRSDALQRAKEREEEERKQREAREAQLKSVDLGRFVLSIEPFDWDPVTLEARPAGPGGLSWQLHSPDEHDPDQPGAVFISEWLRTGRRTVTDLTVTQDVEARGGRAFLVVGREGCQPSTIPLRQLPGYAQRDRKPPVLRVSVPTCAATAADLILVPAGPFIYGGPGDPPSRVQIAAKVQAEMLSQAEFRIDRTEVTNAAYLVFARMKDLTGIEMPIFIGARATSAGPRKAVSNINWFDARAYCRFLGKRLPTSREWLKAMRGGLRLANGKENPMPRRNVPWGAGRPPGPVNVKTAEGVTEPADVGTSLGDVGPHGLLDQAGSVMEWTSTTNGPKGIILRGGNWFDTTIESAADYNAIENERDADKRDFGLGVRCAL